MVTINDVGRAFFHARACRDVYVQFADEDQQFGDERERVKLNYSMHGTRDAAQCLANESADMLISIGATQGKTSPCVYHHKGRRVGTVVRGDGYVSLSVPNQLQWLKEQLEHEYQIKTQWLGAGEGCQQEVKFLNRV